MVLFVVYTAVAAIGFTVAFEAGRVSEQNKVGGDLKDCLPFRDYNWTSEHSKTTAAICLGFFLLEAAVIPGAFNPFSFVKGESSSTLLGLLVYGSWSGMLAVGFGGVVALYEFLTIQQNKLQIERQEYETAKAATQETLDKELQKASRDTRRAIASSAAAAAEWRKVRMAQAQPSTDVTENERVWSKTLLKDSKLDPKALHVVDNAMDKRWREVTSGQRNLEELRKRNLEKNQKLLEQRAQRAQRATNTQTELETEKERLQAMEEKLEDLKKSLGILREERIQLESAKNKTLSERERLLKAKEKSFEQEQAQRLEQLLAKQEALKSREDKFWNGDDKLELDRKAKQLESSMENVAKFKKEIELEEQRKLKEIQEREAALKEEEEQQKKNARQREAALKEMEETQEKLALERETALKEKEERQQEAANQREAELKYQELKWDAIAMEREAALKEREEQWKEIAKQREAALKKKEEEFLNQTTKTLKRYTAFPEDEEGHNDKVHRGSHHLSTIIEEGAGECINEFSLPSPEESVEIQLTPEEEINSAESPTSDCEDERESSENPTSSQYLQTPDQTLEESTRASPFGGGAWGDFVSLIGFNTKSTNPDSNVTTVTETKEVDEEEKKFEAEQTSPPHESNQEQPEGTIVNEASPSGDQCEEPDGCDDETTCVFSGIHSDEEREPVGDHIQTTDDENERIGASSSAHGSMLDGDESDDNSLSDQIKHDIAERNRLNEMRDVYQDDPKIEELVLENGISKTTPLQEIAKQTNWIQRFATRTTGVATSFKDMMPLSPPPHEDDHTKESSTFKDTVPTSQSAESQESSGSVKDSASIATSVAPSIVPITSDITSFNYGDRYAVCSSNNSVEGKVEKENRVRFQTPPTKDEPLNEVDEAAVNLIAMNIERARLALERKRHRSLRR